MHAKLDMKDDRGKPCELAALSGKQLGVRALGITRFNDPHTKEERTHTDGLEITVAIVGGVISVGLWQFLHRHNPVFGTVGLFVGMFLAGPIGAMIVWFAALGLIRRLRFRKLCDVYLAEGRCASCGYDLTGLTPEATDDCIICPECAAAWRAERVE